MTRVVSSAIRFTSLFGATLPPLFFPAWAKNWLVAHSSVPLPPQAWRLSYPPFARFATGVKHPRGSDFKFPPARPLDESSDKANRHQTRIYRSHGQYELARGDCWDSAMGESFFAIVKSELIVDTMWRSRRDGIEAFRQ